MFDIKCIVAIVERGEANRVVKHAKKAGANGATIMYGRGTGESEVQKFLNVNIDASKEIILILSEQDKMRTIVEAIVEAGELEQPGKGIVFTVPITNLYGLDHRDDFVE